MRQLLQAARDRKCPLVVGGDLKHLRDRWVLSALNGLLALFEEYADVPKVLLHGNHDGVAGGRSGLEAFRRLELTWVVTEPCLTTNALLPWKGPGVTAFWPHQPTLDGLPAFLEQARKAKAKVLLAHAFLAGAVLGPDDVRLPGVGATLEQFGLAGKSPQFRWGVFGDVHKFQWVTRGVSGQASVLYSGSPYAQNWGERETDKGALYVDLDAGTVEVVPMKAPRFLVKDLTKVQPQNQAKALEGLLLLGAEDGWAKGDFVRLIVGSWADGKLLERVREASGARAFQVIVQRESRVEQRADVHAGQSSRDLLTAYIKARPLDGTPSDALLSAGLRLIQAEAVCGRSPAGGRPGAEGGSGRRAAAAGGEVMATEKVERDPRMPGVVFIRDDAFDEQSVCRKCGAAFLFRVEHLGVYVEPDARLCPACQKG